jgi:hypothetical protein
LMISGSPMTCLALDMLHPFFARISFSPGVRTRIVTEAPTGRRNPKNCRFSLRKSTPTT